MPIPSAPYSDGALTAPINLASDTRAQQNTILASQNSTVRASLLSAASRQIERICKRCFTLRQYQVYESGGSQPYDQIQLDNFPVSQITRLATRPLAVLTIQNTDTATNQRATIDTTATGVNLTRVASGVATTSTLLYATYPTLTALAGAITALANGWTATVAIGYSLWPSADLKPLQGAVTAINSAANLELFTEDLSAWMGGNWFDSDFGMVCSGPGWRLDADSGIIVGYFPQGYYNIRIDYSAGFATDPDSMPADLQDACVKGAAFLQSAGKWNPASNSIQIGPFKETNQQIVPGFASAVMSLISPYIDHAKTMGWSRP